MPRNRKTRTKEQFIKECEKLHGQLYDYTLTDYKNCKEKVKIVCKTHGVFELIADNHQRKDGCPTCRKEKSIAERKASFIKRAKEIHGDTYDYSLVNYIKNQDKVTLICNVHGEFLQKPLNHLQGNGCNKCNIQKRFDDRLTTDEFIKKAKLIHGDTYLYNKTKYVRFDDPVTIECKHHGIFEQKPTNHIKGAGCIKCGINKISNKFISNTKDFISKAIKIHGNRYDYKDIEYTHSRQKVKIKCSTHGTFEQTPSTHLKGSGCQKCASLINVYKREDYIKLSKNAILYLVLLEFGDEKFYKIGKTKNTTNERLSNNTSIYKHIVVNEYLDTSGTIFDLEIELHNKYLEYKYKPKVIFAGHTECYNLDLPIEEIIKLNTK